MFFLNKIWVTIAFLFCHIPTLIQPKDAQPRRHFGNCQKLLIHHFSTSIGFDDNKKGSKKLRRFIARAFLPSLPPFYFNLFWFVNM
jgi:hypothetical protein